MRFMTSVVYRRNDKGQTVQWRAWAEEVDGVAHLCTEFGHVDGGLRRTKREVTKAGREASLFDKAKHDAVKKWRDKQDKEGYVESLDAVDNVPVLPMLANKAVLLPDKDAVKGLEWPCLAQPKIDGFRCIASLSGPSVQLLSRKNIPYMGFARLRGALGAVARPDSGFGSGRFYLDGELFVPDVDFNALSGLVKRGQHNAEYDIDNLQFRIFDCFDLDHMDVPFATRMRFLSTFAAPGCSVLETVSVEGLDAVHERMQAYLAEGHEGLMLRCPRSPYVLRKRSTKLLKLKEFHDNEFVISSFKEGAGDDRGTVVWECTTEAGRTFWVRPKGTREDRARMFENAAEFVGKRLTVTYQELSKDGIPRFPVGKAIREPFDA